MTYIKDNKDKISSEKASLISYNEDWVASLMEDCTLCPRKCHANRLAKACGFCGQDARPSAARAALHYWEEPCISGSHGSGTVFFSGCNLHCSFCQNYEIAHGKSSREISIRRLCEIFLELQDKGAHNINLVTPTHFIPQICVALQNAKALGLSVPIVYNTGCYESVASLKYLQGLVDIYLPDFKYHSGKLSQLLSQAPDYYTVASSALSEMYRQVNRPVFDPESGLMTRGIIVRHLLLPGQSKDSKKILRYLHEAYGNDIYVSIMNQYTPLNHISGQPHLNRRITSAEYTRILSFAEAIGIENGFFQEGETADESFIPPFDYEGL